MADYLEYITVAGDTFDMIALDYYNDEFKASLIARANRDCAGVITFPAGVRLNVPVIAPEAAATLPPWRR